MTFKCLTFNNFQSVLSFGYLSYTADKKILTSKGYLCPQKVFFAFWHFV